MNGYRIYTAPWVIPVSTGVLRDGAVVVNSDIIVTLGTREQILEEWNDAEIIEVSGILIPALTNCHIHTELSHLTDISPPEEGETIVDWIEQLIFRRASDEVPDAAIISSINETIRQQHRSGVILLGDICNIRENIPQRKHGLVEVYSFYEMLAPNRQRTAEALKILSEIPIDQSVSPHAVYSTSAQLIATLKERADENDQIVSIHLAESKEELEFISNRSGAFRTFLEKRKSWDGTISPDCPYKGSADYLKKLNVLDEKTLCVHCVHVDDEEIAILAETKAKVCLCPGSNEFLGVGRAPLDTMLASGILPGIGTDSSTSNSQLDIWHEMKILLRNFPGVPASTIFKMATFGGAAALHREKDYGTLSPGRKPVFLEIPIPATECSAEEELLEAIILRGKPEKIRWIVPAGQDV